MSDHDPILQLRELLLAQPAACTMTLPPFDPGTIRPVIVCPNDSEFYRVEFYRWSGDWYRRDFVPELLTPWARIKSTESIDAIWPDASKCMASIKTMFGGAG